MQDNFGMHFEFLVEGQSELTTLSIIMNRIIGEYNQPHTWRIHKHRGVGRLPDNLNDKINVNDRTLLHNFPSKLKAYGKSMGENEAVVLLIDLDDRKNCIEFKTELFSVLEACEKKPNLLIRIAIEELESWFLGDRNAILKSYPHAKIKMLENYAQDSQRGTWEFLLEVIGDSTLKKLHKTSKRSPLVIEEKVKWARKIAPNMNVESNLSPSFICFRDGLRKFIE